jgi:RND family efflux transporter MFP subunit
LIIIFFFLLALGAGVAWELSQRKGQAAEVAANTIEDATRTPTVLVTKLRSAPSAATIEIAGQTVPLTEVSIYARTDGYIKERPVDLGNKVKSGDLLVRLDTPDLDQQIEQAKATLAQSKAALAQLKATVQSNIANLRLAKLTADRTKKLATEGVLAQQDADNTVAAQDSADANLNASQESVRAQEALINANDASLKRLVEQKGFAVLTAPFDGVITYRNNLASDIGTLISSGSSTSSREILRIAQIKTLRVFVNVPQTYATMIQPGQVEELVLDEMPGRVFHATVKTTSHEVDPSTRTMLAVLVVDNSNEELLPGMYAKIRFKLNHTVNVLRLPGDGLVFRTEGPVAAVVGKDHRVHYHKLTLGRDYGSEVEVTDGLEPGDLVVLNPTDAVAENAVVDPKERTSK